MLMMDSLRTRNLTVPTFGEDDCLASAGHASDALAKAGGSDHLASILAFLGGEVERSATLLRDLAAGISEDFGAICAAEVADDVQDRLIAATMALQNEDRLQQRLGDLRTALSVLEQTLVEGRLADQVGLDRAIIDKLRLEETRSAFASSMGLSDAEQHPPKVVKEPSLGDIDLF